MAQSQYPDSGNAETPTGKPWKELGISQAKFQELQGKYNSKYPKEEVNGEMKRPDNAPTFAAFVDAETGGSTSWSWLLWGLPAAGLFALYKSQ